MGIRTYPLALPAHHGWAAMEGGSSVQLLRWDRPGFDGRRDRESVLADHFGADNAVSIYDVNVPNW